MRARSFLVGTVLLVLVILLIGVASAVAGDDGPATIEVGVVSERSEAIVGALEQAAAPFDLDAAVTFFAELDEARAALADGEVQVAVDLVDNEALFDGQVDQQVLAIVQQSQTQLALAENLADAGLDPGQAAEVVAIQPIGATTLDGDDAASGIGVLVGSLSAILLLISLTTFGTYVLTGVVEEKSSAVVEVLLVRVSADQLLAGKIIGIGVAALTQFSAAVAAALVSLAVSGIDVPPEIWSALPMMLVWFLAGFALYSTLFALAGSLVSRQEDAQSAAAPINYGLVGAYLTVLIFGYAPESTASIVLSVIPPTAPFLMPMRMAVGAASVLEVAVAVLGLGLAIVAIWKSAGRIYEQVLLRRGSRIGWRDALALVRR